MKKAAFAAVIVLSATFAAQAGQVVDMRACPLDTITFVDPVAGGLFSVDRVGKNYSYVCDGRVTVRQPAGQSCDGPYGDLVLQGRLIEPEDSAPRIVFAVWEVLKAAPCCGWSVLDQAKGRALTRASGFHWLDHEQVPRLGDVGFASIAFDDLHRDGIAIFSAPKVAMRCELAD